MSNKFYSSFKKKLATLRYWPVHPQWLIYRRERSYRRQLAQQVSGHLLDIGCADQAIRQGLPDTCHYIGLDYYQTATQWYSTRPDVYGDAQQLPFRDQSLDTVLLLDVLEHLPNPERCFQEIARVLKPQGQLFLKVPCLYPLHDRPLDFQRWTSHGLLELARRHGLVITEMDCWGSPMETAILLTNLALSKLVINGLQHRHPALLLALPVPIIILTLNLWGWLFNLIPTSDDFMPYSYVGRLIKL